MSDKVYVVTSHYVYKEVLGVYRTAEAAIAAHDGLWMAGRPDPDGRLVWINQRACAWHADPKLPLRIVEHEVN